ncbi:MAG: DRTGG domain-containing protein [Spirochaetota bacterium]
MRIKEIQKILEAEMLTGSELAEKIIEGAAASDLMSDVLTLNKSNLLLLTGLTNPQTVRTAEMTDIAAVCFVRGKSPQQETISLAEKKKIPLLSTKLSMFEACGRLYAAGLACDH